jgi:hypothetical protein
VDLHAILARYGLTPETLTADAVAQLDPTQRAALLAALQTEAHSLAASATDDALAQLHTVVAAVELVDAQTPPQAPARPAQRPATTLAVRRPAQATPRPAAARSAITAAGGRQIGTDDLAAEVAGALDHLRRGIVLPNQLSAAGRVLVASMTAAGQLPRLGQDHDANTATVSRIMAEHRQALTAAGGLCGPAAPRYDVAGRVDATDLRPIANGLPRAEADRGAITFQRPPELEDVDGGLTVWTEANDQNPADPTTKNVVVATCGDEVEVVVDAIVRRMQVGNFRARYFPEQVAGWLRTLEAAHARLAERTLLDTIDAGSTAVTAGQVLGTARDVLATIDRATAVLRDRRRLDPDAWLTLIAPQWLRNQLRTDVARQLPGDDLLAASDERIAGWFAARQVSVIWALDGTAGQSFTAQGAGPLQGWPSTVVCRLFPADTWLYLDGGTLDLGVLRDSTLNATNDAEMFAETFENVARVGHESWTLTMDTCPDGATSATVDIDPCATGS